MTPNVCVCVCVCVITTKHATKICKAVKQLTLIFWLRSGNSLDKVKNHSGTTKPGKSTIQKKKLVTKNSYSHNLM
jgi:hypothetical protein